MFDIDRWQEIFDALHKNKLRTFLTSLSVASGIFILVILLGFGQGMQNGIQKEFENDATNRIWVWSQTTTKEYKGLNPGRRIRLENQDLDYINSAYQDELDSRSGVVYVRANSINYKQESVAYSVQGVSPGYQFIENQELVTGRYLNQTDIDNFAKVVVVSNKIQRELFKSGEDPLQEFIQISGINFKVIGIYSDRGGEREEDRFFIPRTTAQRVFNGSNTLNNLAFTLQPEDNFEKAVAVSNKFKNEMLQHLREAHVVSPEDESAINAFNTLDEAKKFYVLNNNIAFFFWFVGICTIIAGVVGVSNIMLIVVKERTKEIGIRKALGAQPWSIIGMVLQEAIFVTSIAGFTGLILSMGLLELVGPNIEVDYILNPSVNFRTAVIMVFVLIIAGALAGFFPAYRAAHIKPIEALRDE